MDLRGGPAAVHAAASFDTWGRATSLFGSAEPRRCRRHRAPSALRRITKNQRRSSAKPFRSGSAPCRLRRSRGTPGWLYHWLAPCSAQNSALGLSATWHRTGSRRRTMRIGLAVPRGRSCDPAGRAAVAPGSTGARPHHLSNCDTTPIDRMPSATTPSAAEFAEFQTGPTIPVSSRISLNPREKRQSSRLPPPLCSPSFLLRVSIRVKSGRVPDDSKLSPSHGHQSQSA